MRARNVRFRCRELRATFPAVIHRAAEIVAPPSLLLPRTRARVLSAGCAFLSGIYVESYFNVDAGSSLADL